MIFKSPVMSIEGKNILLIIRMEIFDAEREYDDIWAVLHSVNKGQYSGIEAKM